MEERRGCYRVFVKLSAPLQPPALDRQLRSYFQLRRKSGGGECGPPRLVHGTTYCIDFDNPADQQAVLKRSPHQVVLGGQTVVVVVRESPEPPEPPSPSAEHVEGDPTPPAQGGGGVAADDQCPPVGDGDEDAPPTDDTQTFGGAKLWLLWRENEEAWRRDFPQVRVERGDARRLAVGGPPQEVRRWREKTLQEESLVLERLVSGLTPHLFAFLRTEFALPGRLEESLGLGEKVAMEMGDSQLHIFSLAAVHLDQAQNFLRREFKEEFLDVPKCCAALQSALRSKVSQMNRGERRVQVLSDPDGTVCLLGRGGPVEQLLQNVSSHVLAAEALGASSVTVASYCLSGGLQLLLCEGDITQLHAEALVNAANEGLQHSGGVAAALSEAGGPRVGKESRALVKQRGRIPAGEVVATSGGNLPCRALLHAVGPVGGMSGAQGRALLEKVVHAALDAAEASGLKTLALPCISAGEAGFSASECAEAIVSAVGKFSHQGGGSLRGIVLIDNKAAVVRSIKETCDRLLGGVQEDAASGGGETGNGVYLEIVEGTIESQQVDALVCPMAGHRPFSTKIGSILYEQLGGELNDRFKAAAAEETWPGAAVLLENLPAPLSKAVIFANLPPWNGDQHGTTVEVLRHAIWNILSLCRSSRFASVAFPVLGAGVALRFPPGVVARALLQEVLDFEGGSERVSPLLVRIVVVPGDEESWEVLHSVWAEMKNKESTKEARQPGKGSAASRIVLLGKTGTGKSNLANTIFGEELFTIYHSPNSGTHSCQAETKSIGDRQVTLVDTPGFFDTSRPEEQMKNEILKCITECSPGPHAFLIVLKVDKYTEQEEAVIANIRQYFSEEVFKYSIVVFTHGDQLQGKTIRDFVDESECLRDFVRKCGDRCFVIDNRHWVDKEGESYRSNRVQVEQLLATLDQMIKDNDGSHYSNEILEKVERALRQEERSIRGVSPDMPPDQVRKEAKSRLAVRWGPVSGAVTGALLSAFFGVARIPPSGPLAIALALLTGLYQVVRGGSIGYHAAAEAESVQQGAWLAVKASVFERKRR